MRFILLILLFMTLSCQSQTQAEIKMPCDTTKFVLKNLDAKPVIIRELYNCFVNGKFRPLVIYFRTYVEFSIKHTDKLTSESTYLTETITEYGAVQKLDDIFSQIKYSHFVIMSAKTNANEDILIARLSMEEDESSILNVCFILDSSNAIKTVVFL